MEIRETGNKNILSDKNTVTASFSEEGHKSRGSAKVGGHNNADIDNNNTDIVYNMGKIIEENILENSSYNDMAIAAKQGRENEKLVDEQRNEEKSRVNKYIPEYDDDMERN